MKKYTQAWLLWRAMQRAAWLHIDPEWYSQLVFYDLFEIEVLRDEGRD